MWILPVVDNVKYLTTSMTGQFQDSLIFSLTLALTPIATILIWKFAPVFRTQRRILTACIIILAMTISVLARREMIKSQARNLQPTTVIDYSDPDVPTNKSIEALIPLPTLKFEIFALIGLIGGGIISYFSLKEKSPV